MVPKATPTDRRPEVDGYLLRLFTHQAFKLPFFCSQDDLMITHLLTAATTIGRLLTFRLTREEILEFGPVHFIAGLLCTLLVGIGRTLHNTRVEWWQHLGLGSVAYVFVLSLLLWLLLWPLRVADLSYRRVLTFVALTAPTGIIYAIPVESFFTVHEASGMRELFLFVVASWRVALWFYFLICFCRLPLFSTLVVAVLPLCGIVHVLMILNLDRIVFEFMMGIPNPSSDDGSSFLLWIATGLATLAMGPLSLSYLVLVSFACLRPKKT